MRYLLLLLSVLGLYLLENPFTISSVGSFTVNYVIKPLLWSGIAMAVFLLPALRYKGKLRTRSFINSWSFIFAVVFISVQFLAGLVDGFGKSPYDHSIFGITINILSVGTMLAGRELFRSYIVNSFSKNENYVVFLTVSFFMTLIAFPMQQYLDIQGYSGSAQFISQFFLPEFSKNFLATYLVFIGGPVPSLIFLGTLEAFKWLSPILPNLQWITAALVGILTPVFLFTILQSMFEVESKLRRKREIQKEGHASLIITTLLSVVIVWFAVGVFPVYPSVIATGSMEPMIYPGDVILVKKTTDIKEVQIGDVIQFEMGKILISHRITEIIVNEDGVPNYRTKGDNNNVEDSQLVSPDKIRGEIIKVVPKIGWPTLFMKSNKDAPPEEMES